MHRNPPPTIRKAAEATTPARGVARGAFTLVELIVVMAIMVALVSLSGPFVRGLREANDVNKVVYDVAGLLTQARAYAVTNNTYVYLGLGEFDISKSSSDTQTAGTGRLGMAVFASKEGAKGYQTTSPETTWQNGYSAGAGFTVAGNLQTFENLHLVNLGERPTSGGMARPPYGNQDAIEGSYNLGDDTCKSVTPFAYPLGKALGSGKYNFTKVIQFSPQGVARIQTSNNYDLIAPWLEIGIQQTHGSSYNKLTPPVKTGQVVAIQISGVTGAVRIYRP